MNALIFIVAGVASLTDVRSYRIPNWLTFGSILVGLLLNIYMAGWSGLLLSLAGLVLGGFILMPFFVAGGMGAGDVKLMAAFGALGGPTFAINTLLAGSLFGGVAALCKLLCKYGYNEFFSRLFLAFNIKGAHDKDVLPYGVFLSAGAVLSCFWGLLG